MVLLIPCFYTGLYWNEVVIFVLKLKSFNSDLLICVLQAVCMTSDTYPHRPLSATSIYRKRKGIYSVEM